MSKRKSFKYQFPLKHVRLNSLPRELYPQPMRKFNYDVVGLDRMKKQYIHSQQTSDDASSDQDIMEVTRKNYTEQSTNPPALKSHFLPIRQPLSKLKITAQNIQKVITPRQQIAAKTELLCRMQNESSQEAQSYAMQGLNFSLNLHDKRIIMSQKDMLRDEENSSPQPAYYQKKLPKSLNDQVLRYMSDTSYFEQNKEIVKNQLRERMYFFYRNALETGSEENKEYLQGQATKYREFVKLDPYSILSEQENKVQLIKKHRQGILRTLDRSYDQGYQSTTQIEPNRKDLMNRQSLKKQRLSKTTDKTSNQLLKVQIECKTVEHHKLIKKLKARTASLYKQWVDFKEQENSITRGEKLRNQQLKVLEGFKGLNPQSQIYLRQEFLQILKMHQQQQPLK